jgi:hypothetical protein
VIAAIVVGIVRRNVFGLVRPHNLKLPKGHNDRKARAPGRVQGVGEVLHDQTHRKFANRPLQLQKRSQLFIHSHNETLSVAAGVCDPERAALAIQR